MAPVTVLHTREQQEALATTGMYRKKFYVTGGKHVTLDNMFKAAEMNKQTEEANEREREKEIWVENHEGASDDLSLDRPDP